mmetsp:Transcript_70894/g.169762  ORF Transcript_70894/g.169762 Transcript_70894/m.169762 type:complete len:345 (-) Transcript_70894:879-1913(-)
MVADPDVHLRQVLEHACRPYPLNQCAELDALCPLCNGCLRDLPELHCLEQRHVHRLQPIVVGEIVLMLHPHQQRRPTDSRQFRLELLLVFIQAPLHECQLHVIPFHNVFLVLIEPIRKEMKATICNITAQLCQTDLTTSGIMLSCIDDVLHLFLLLRLKVLFLHAQHLLENLVHFHRFTGITRWKVLHGSSCALGKDGAFVVDLRNLIAQHQNPQTFAHQPDKLFSSMARCRSGFPQICHGHGLSNLGLSLGLVWHHLPHGPSSASFMEVGALCETRQARQTLREARLSLLLNLERRLEAQCFPFFVLHLLPEVSLRLPSQMSCANLSGKVTVVRCNQPMLRPP